MDTTRNESYAKKLYFMQNTKILLVEDDTRLVEMLKDHFSKQGWETVSASTGEEALIKYRQNKPDMVILDRNLPDMDGIEICKSLRELGFSLRVLMLTGYSEELDIVSGLENGADDYVGKPFRLAELIARIKALLRRGNSEDVNSITTEIPNEVQLRIKISSREVFKNAIGVYLTAREFDLLLFLAKNPGRVYTRSQILSNVWNSNTDCYEQSINTIVKRLRNKIEADATNPVHLETVRGIGYRYNSLHSKIEQ